MRQKESDQSDTQSTSDIKKLIIKHRHIPIVRRRVFLNTFRKSYQDFLLTKHIKHLLPSLNNERCNLTVAALIILGSDLSSNPIQEVLIYSSTSSYF